MSFFALFLLWRLCFLEVVQTDGFGGKFVAFYDWNRDGKKNFADDYIEYNIYKESTKNNNTNNYSNNSNSGCAFWFWFSVIMIILGIITNLD